MSSSSSVPVIETLIQKWRDEAMTHAVMPPGGKATVAQLNEAYLRVSDAKRQCAQELADALTAERRPAQQVMNKRKMHRPPQEPPTA